MVNRCDKHPSEETLSGASSAGPFGFSGKASTVLDFIIDPVSASAFDSLLQAGFLVTCNVGTTIRNLLHDQFGVGENSIEERISTIFLDGKPVDDIDSVTVKNGATLALSGAMPGLVGATLRRKSPLASFRRTISSSDLIRKEEGTSTGIIRIKIFNVLINDIGPLFLERGIFLSACTLKSFLENLPDGFWRGCEAVTVNDQVRAGGGSKEHVLSAVGDGWVHLSVKKKS